MTAAPAVFGRRVVVGLVVVAGVSFATALALSIGGEDAGPLDNAGANGFSRSAIGHEAVIDLLRRLGVDVSTSRFDSARRARERGLLVLAEPHAGAGSISGMLHRAERALVVLPKWQGSADPARPWCVRSVALHEAVAVATVLRPLDQWATVARPEAPGAWSSALGVAPTLVRPQLVRSRNVEPIVECDEGILFGRVTGTSWYVLSDPDVLNNHGLAHDRNALLAARLVDRARGGRDAVLFDETLHGFEQVPDLFRSLFEYPLVLATLQTLLAVGVLLWAGMGRFGAPLPAPRALGAGKDSLIANVASLLRLGGRAGDVLPRTLRLAVADVGRRLHVPRGPEARARLARHEEARGTAVRLTELEELVRRFQRTRREEPVVDVAQRIHRWKEEMIHGSRHRP